MSWYVARGLDVLLGQLNAKAPNRSKVSDGSIGDASHSARESDHNPTGTGQVCARDFTNDPAGGLAGQWLADALVASRDPRIKYVIFNHRIIDSRAGQHPWQWMPYSGANAHEHHVHVSVLAGALGDNTAPWNLGAGTSEEIDMTPDQSRKLDELVEQFTASRDADKYPGWARLAPATVSKATLVDFVRQSYEDLQKVKTQLDALKLGGVDIDVLAAKVGEKLADQIAEKLAARLAA